MSEDDPVTGDPSPTAAETVGRTAGRFAKFAVRQALKSKTIREQVRDARAEADKPLAEPPQPG